MTSLRTDRTALGRARERGSHARDDVHAVLDAALVCHLAVTTADGPLVLPTIHARVGDVVYVHGSVAARWLRAQGQVCLTATLVDGLVLARSAFHHSMNYRSVVVRGAARVVTDAGEVDLAVHAITEHVLPGRWDAVRPPSRKELAATTVLALDLLEASVKTRSGPPNDKETDLAADGAAQLWAGVLPLRTVFGTPVPDDVTAVEPPPHVALAGHDVTARRDVDVTA